MSALAALVFVGLLLFSVPIAHSLLIASGFAMIVHEPLYLFEAVLNLYKPSSQFPMLAIPFFILAGDLMMSGQFGEYLVKFSKILVGRMKGGLSQVSVVGSLFFGGVSGSAVADASALGNALIPVQKKQGYPSGFSAAVNASSSTISVLIPPSIPLILYGLVTETSIPKLFIAGIVPGVMLTVLMFVICFAIGRIGNLPVSHTDGENNLKLGDLLDLKDIAAIGLIVCVFVAVWFFGVVSWWLALGLGVAMLFAFLSLFAPKFSFRKIPSDIFKAIPALLMPIFVVVLARGGVVTPTEISVFAVVYALLVGLLIYRDLSFTIILRCILTTGIMTGIIMLVIMGSSVLQWVLSFESVPENMAAWMLESFKSPWVIILGMNLLMILIGTFLDLPAAILLLAPIFIGIAPQIGLDSVQLGVMMVVNLAIGLYTPPVGTTLFVSVAIEKVPMGKVIKYLFPFYFAGMAVLIFVSFVDYVPWFIHD